MRTIKGLFNETTTKRGGFNLEPKVEILMNNLLKNNRINFYIEEPTEKQTQTEMPYRNGAKFEFMYSYKQPNGKKLIYSAYCGKLEQIQIYNSLVEFLGYVVKTIDFKGKKKCKCCDGKGHIVSNEYPMKCGATYVGGYSKFLCFDCDGIGIEKK